MDSNTTKKFKEEPKRKFFGWSHYNEEITVSYENNGKVLWVQVANITGKKFCLFNMFIWDYQIEVIDSKQYQPA